MRMSGHVVRSVRALGALWFFLADMHGRGPRLDPRGTAADLHVRDRVTYERVLARTPGAALKHLASQVRIWLHQIGSSWRSRHDRLHEIRIALRSRWALDCLRRVVATITIGRPSSRHARSTSCAALVGSLRVAALVSPARQTSSTAARISGVAGHVGPGGRYNPRAAVAVRIVHGLLNPIRSVASCVCGSIRQTRGQGIGQFVAATSTAWANTMTARNLKCRRALCSTIRNSVLRDAGGRR